MTNILKVLGYIIIFVIMNLIFSIFFPPVLTPAGEIGSIKPLNSLFSIVYIVCWAIAAVLAGIKKNKKIFAAAIIYTLLPLAGLALYFFKIGFGTFMVLFIFLWNSITQGIFHDSSGIFIYTYFPAIMLLIFAAFYLASSPLFKILGTRFKNKDF
ncbi:MAG TPA: hypothetical protein VF941_07860 [Clostridia bacterium]